MKKSWAQTDKGFTLIEVLVVAGMLAVVMTAIYSIYRTQQRSAYVQDDVVEVQQNLRIALDSITKDIRLAGLLLKRIPPAELLPGESDMLPIETIQTSNNTGMGKKLDDITEQPIAAASDSLTLNTISSTPSLATATIDLSNMPDGLRPGVGAPFIVDSAESLDYFVAHVTDGDLVKIVRPELMNAKTGDPDDMKRTYRVTAKNKAALTMTLTQLPITADNPSAAAKEFKHGDLIVKVPAGALNPCTVQYYLTDNAGLPACPVGLMCLARSENNGAVIPPTVVATNITDLQFFYINGRGTPVGSNLRGSTIHTPLGPNSEDEVRAVRVEITGLTTASVGLSDNQAKMRKLESVVKLNNKK